LQIGEIFVHGVLTAFVGAYLGSLLASTFCPGLGSFAEILLTCGIIAALMRLGIYGASFESPYFKRYFILDHGYECVIAVSKIIVRKTAFLYGYLKVICAFEITLFLFTD